VTIETSQDQLETVWGAEGIHAFINFPGSLQQIYYHLQRGHIDADKLGEIWVTTKTRLRKQFSGENRVMPFAKAAEAPPPKAADHPKRAS
jgi:hypothetical protein